MDGDGDPQRRVQWYPPTNREIEIMGTDKILITDDKVQEHRIYYNLQEMFEQLGLTDEGE